MPTEDAMTELQFLERLYHLLPPGSWVTQEAERRIARLGGPAYAHGGRVRAGAPLVSTQVEGELLPIFENTCAEGCICHLHAA